MLLALFYWFSMSILPVAILVCIQNMISRLFAPIVLNSRASKVLYMSTAIVGVPIHELSHAVMAILFNHRVTKIKFFQFSDCHGRLGYVNHEWNAASLYQNTGLLFIGIAPLIGATAFIVFSTWWLAPSIFDEVHFHLMNNLPVQLHSSSIIDIAMLIVSENHQILKIIWSSMPNDYFGIWLLVASAIAFHATPSAPDMHCAWKGALIVGFLLTCIADIYGDALLTGIVLAVWSGWLSIMGVVLAFSILWWLPLGVTQFLSSYVTGRWF